MKWSFLPPEKTNLKKPSLIRIKSKSLIFYRTIDYPVMGPHVLSLCINIGVCSFSNGYLCFPAPGPGPRSQIRFEGTGPEFVFHDSGPQFVFIGPRPSIWVRLFLVLQLKFIIVTVFTLYKLNVYLYVLTW